MTAPLPDLERVYAEAFNASQDADETTDAHDARRAGLLAVYRAGQNKWVSVEERLPEPVHDKGWVRYSNCVLGLISGTKHSIRVIEAVFSPRKDFVAWVGAENITHWQPLPEPPQSVTEGAE